MKLFEITDPLADDPKYVLNSDHKERSIQYMWNQLYKKWEVADINSLEEQKAHAKLAKYKHLWAKVPYCAFCYAHDIIQGKFPEGESAIATDLHYKKWYENEFNCEINQI